MERLRAEGKSDEQITGRVRDELFQIGFGGDIMEVAGEIIGFELGLKPLKAGIKGISAIRKARGITRDVAAERIAAKAAPKVEEAAVKIAEKATVSAPPTKKNVIQRAAAAKIKADLAKQAETPGQTVEKLFPKLGKGEKLDITKGAKLKKPKPKKQKVDKILSTRADNIEKRLAATGKKRPATKKLLESARADLKAGKVKEAEATLKTAAGNVAKIEKPPVKKGVLGKRGELFIGGEGKGAPKTPEGKAIFADLAKQAKIKARRPTAFGPSKAQAQQAERSLQELKARIRKSGKNATEYMKSQGATPEEVLAILPKLREVAEPVSFAGRKAAPTAKEFLQGAGKKVKVDPADFGDEIVTEFIGELPAKLEAKGPRAVTKFMRKQAADDRRLRRGFWVAITDSTAMND